MATNNVRREKFINYVKEAFKTPFHLALFGVISAVSVVGTFLAFQANTPFDPAVFIMLGAGAELTLLGAITRSDRFVRAINAKYKDKIDEYYKTMNLADYYNKLSSNAQKRFDKLRGILKEVRDRYKKVGVNSQSLVDGFLKKIEAIETTYIRLIFFKDKFPELANDSILYETQRELDTLNQEMKAATGKLKEIKAKRLRLLELKLENFYKIRENKEIIEERLQTIEDMVEYIKDQPMTMMQSDKDDIMIDNILFDAEQTQESLAEIESMMQSEFSYNSDDSGGYDSNPTNKIKE